ncbi:MAG: PQQ-like beta-propeller repeat protein [Planctomycetaceae bacterium]|jgi:outer membrane protein assembly factor BamB|nr:PQQ-like beta-propeller repeat protein [Planctomycetaceae bacterium]
MMLRKVSLTRWLMLSTGLLLSGQSQAEDWLQFRGPYVGGASNKASLPGKFDGESGENIAWKVSIPGRSVGGAIVVGDQVITTTSDGLEQRRIRLLSYDATSGKPRWEQQLVARGRPYCHPTSANAAPTPASDGKHVVAFFSSNDIACTDLQGNLLWYRSLASDFPKAGNDVGMSASPTIVDGVVVVQVECQGDSFALGMNVSDGTTVWKKERPRKANWASPTSVALPSGKNAVVMQSSENLVAVNPADGKELWKIDMGCSTTPSSTVSNGRLIVPSGGLTALDLSSAGAPSKLWFENKLNSTACSPLVDNDKVYVVNRTILVCGDLFTGKVLWQLRIPDANQIWSSPVIANKRLYLFSMDGSCAVVSLDGEEGKIESVNKLGDEVLGSPAIAGNAMFVRGAQNLWKIQSK